MLKLGRSWTSTLKSILLIPVIIGNPGKLAAVPASTGAQRKTLISIRSYDNMLVKLVAAVAASALR